MDKNYPFPWKSAFDWLDWVERNCMTCRFNSASNPSDSMKFSCPVPTFPVDRAQRKDRVGPEIVSVIFPPFRFSGTFCCPIVGPRCHNKKDVRGRHMKR